MVKRITIAEFKEKASKKFNGRFNYDKVDFIHSREAVSILCPDHGEFLQIPFLHLKSKYGCSLCAGVGKKTTEGFINQAQKIHGEKYSYKRSLYNGNKEKLIITCPIHGDFKKTPIAHIHRKEECPECTGRLKMDKELFIKKAQSIHGDKYVYDNVVYKNTHTNVEIFCKVKEHSSFFVSPANHLHKISPQGCPLCGREKGAQLKSMTTAEFITKANQKHDNKYSYENTTYTRSNKKLNINCPIHGEFEQQANSHLQGTGCPGCGKLKNHSSNKKELREFIKEAQNIHGSKYNYSKVEYLNTHSKVCIICSIEGHGEFWQEANSHLRGSGCPGCYGKTRLSTMQFIEKAIKIHGDKYDYSKVNYISTHEKVIIICRNHGEFKQTPCSHLNGSGCSKCNSRPKITHDYFIKKATEKHAAKYDYSKVKFQSKNNEVTIICPVHGEFQQKPRNHIRSGCPICGGSYKLNTEKFIAKAKLVHDDFYSYEDTIYVNSSTKVKIKCPYHGTFPQIPPSHLKGHGCKFCKNSRGEFRIKKYLKALGIPFEYQFSSEDCRNIYPLPFDFAIAVEKRISLIEFNGEQHYKEIDFGFGRKSDLENIKLRDGIKKSYCENNNIPLLVINFIDFNMIEQLIDEFIKKIPIR